MLWNKLTRSEVLRLVKRHIHDFTVDNEAIYTEESRYSIKISAGWFFYHIEVSHYNPRYEESENKLELLQWLTVYSKRVPFFGELCRCVETVMPENNPLREQLGLIPSVKKSVHDDNLRREILVPKSTVDTLAEAMRVSEKQKVRKGVDEELKRRRPLSRRERETLSRRPVAHPMVPVPSPTSPKLYTPEPEHQVKPIRLQTTPTIIAYLREQDSGRQEHIWNEQRKPINEFGD